MKGTFFSADFVEDSTGNLRLTEVNTDTTISTNNLVYLNFNDFISVLQTNNITKVIVIHKPNIHQEIVDTLSLSISTNAPFITSFTEVKEQVNKIYPTTVEDAQDTFILRLAYDESAIFDSEYSKGTLNLLKLFSDYDEQNDVVEFYHSSSTHGTYNTISPDLNGSNLPDCLIKNVTDETHSLIEFYKIGSESSTDTNESRWGSFVSAKSASNNIIQKYHTNSNILANNRTYCIRTFSIIYGGNLSLIHVGQFQENAVFELPTESLHNQSQYVNQIDTKHYYEFATNFIKNDGSYGLLNTHLVIKSDGTEAEIGTINVGDQLKSYFVGTVNVDEDDLTYNSWHISGNTLPSDAQLTSSSVVYRNSKALLNKTLCNITVNNNEDSIYVSYNKAFLVYDSDQNKIVWKTANKIKVMSDYLLDYDGSTAQVTNNEIMIIEEDGFSLVEIDVEDTDTYIIAGSTPVNAFVSHNAPCFISGTKILISDGTKNIEDIKAGDLVLTMDLKTGLIVENTVNAVFSKKVNHTVEYKFDNNETLRCTLDHPIYVENKGWSSYSDELSNKMYSLEETVKKIEIGDKVKQNNGFAVLVNIDVINEDVIVYNLQDIENNQNFFANNILVHNRIPQPKI